MRINAFSASYTYLCSQNSILKYNNKALPNDTVSFSDKEEKNQINAFGSLFISFGSRRKKPVYAISENGKYKRFESVTEAAKVLKTTGQNVSHALVGRENSAGGCVIIAAEKAEKTDENGNVTVDKKVIKEAMTKFENAKLHKPIYSIRLNGSYKRYEGVADAAKALKISASSIRKFLDNDYPNTKGLVFVYADTLEKVDKKGNPVIKPNAISDITKKILPEKPYKSVYAIDMKTGEAVKYPSQVELAKAIGVSKQCVNQVLSGKSHSTNGYYIVFAEDI